MDYCSRCYDYTKLVSLNLCFVCILELELFKKSIQTFSSTNNITTNKLYTDKIEGFRW